jgi:hypothetical protein
MKPDGAVTEIGIDLDSISGYHADSNYFRA